MAKFTFRRHKLAAAICTAALLMPVSVQAKRDYSLCTIRQQTCLLRLCKADNGGSKL